MSNESASARTSLVRFTIDGWAVLVAFVLAALIRANLFPSVSW